MIEADGLDLITSIEVWMGGFSCIMSPRVMAGFGCVLQKGGGRAVGLYMTCGRVYGWTVMYNVTASDGWVLMCHVSGCIGGL